MFVFLGCLSLFSSSVAPKLPEHIAANRHEPRQNHQLQWQAVLPRDESIERDCVQPSGFLGTWVLQILGNLCWTFLANFPLQRQLFRHYPKDFGVAVASLVAKQPPVADLRNKQHLDPMLTDREFFSPEGTYKRLVKHNGISTDFLNEISRFFRWRPDTKR